MPTATALPPTPPEPQTKDTGPNPRAALANFFGKIEKTPTTDDPGAGNANAGTTKDGLSVPDASTVASAAPVATPTNLTQTATDSDEDETWPRDAKDWKIRKANQARKLAEREATIATLKQEKAEIESKFKELPKDDPEKPLLKSQIEELKGQVKQFSEQLYSAARERHPDFVAKYDKKIETAMNLADAVTGKGISKLLQLPEGDYRDEKLQEIFDELPEMKRARLGPILNEIDLLRSQKASELKTSREEFETMVKKHQMDLAAAEEKKAKEEMALAETMWESAKAKREALKTREGDEAFNAALLKRINLTRDVMLGKADPETVINTMLNAAEQDVYKTEAESLREEVRQLKEQVATVRGAAPRLGDTGTQKGDGKVPVTSGMSPKQALSAWIQNTVKAGT